MLDATHSTPAQAAEDAAAAAAPAAARPAAPEPAPARRPTPLPLRNDTLLGVCEAIGQDFPINANLLRIAFAIGLFFSPVGTIAAYLGLGALVALSRLLFPRRAAEPAAPGQRPAPALGEDEQPGLPLAA